MQSIEELKEKAEQFSKVSGKKSQGVSSKRKGTINKYEKFLSDNCFSDSGQDHKSSLIRILDTLSR